MKTNFKIKNTEINGVFIIEYSKSEEERGNIWTTYQKNSLKNISELSSLNFIHDKFSISNFNVFRGFHGDKKSYKLVTCVFGEITQLVLDCRKKSKNLGKVISISMDRKKGISVLIPPGCGNAYHVKSEQAVYHYKLSYVGNYVDSKDQFTIPWHSKKIKNFPFKDFNPIVSERDK